MGCLEENTVQAFAEARLPADAVADVEAHARACGSCQDLLAAVLRVPGIARTAATQVLGPASSSDPAGERTIAAAEAAPVVREPLEPGTRLDRYTVLGLVGRGGMGEVYAAYDPNLDRRVALKLMSGADAEKDSLGQERLMREARAIAKLSHPNVVVVYEVGAFRGQVYMSMEFIDGVTLASWLAESPRSWRQILDVFLQAARGLSAAHVAGLVHRDFKPQNVMVARNGSVRVMDFGLARRTGADASASEDRPHGESNVAAGTCLTHTGQLVGTPLFMAPEQLTKGSIDGRTDQFSFCVSLHWALYGVHPFGGSSVAGAVARPQLVPPSAKHGVPAAVHAAVTRGLKLSAAARWPSMEALIGALSLDPTRTQRRALAALAVVLAFGGTAVGAASLSRRAHSPCEAGPSRLADVWELGDDGPVPGSRRRAVEDAVLRSGSARALAIWERVSSTLDRHAARWLGSYREACEATHLRGEQSEDVLDLRMACLNDNLESMRAVTHLLSAGERAVIDHAAEAASSLDELLRCEASEQLQSAPRPPKDPILRGKVAKLNARLKEGLALFSAGQGERATALAREVLVESEALQYLPTQAEALLLDGLANADGEPGRPAAVQLERAVFIGEHCGHDRVVAAAAALLVASSWDDPPAAERWGRLSAAAIGRMGGDPVLESWLANDTGLVRFHQGQFEDGLREEERALALKERALGPDHIDVARTLTNMSIALVKLRLVDRAAEVDRRAMLIFQQWAPGAPGMAPMLVNHGDVLVLSGRLDEAERAYEGALSVVRVADAEGARLTLISATKGLADVAMDRRDVAQAISRYEEALSMAETSSYSLLELAELRFEIGERLDRDPRTRVRGLELARQALAVYVGRKGFEEWHAAMQAWVDERAARRGGSRNRGSGHELMSIAVRQGETPRRAASR